MLIYDAYVPRGIFSSRFFISYHALNTSSYTPLHIRTYELDTTMKIFLLFVE